MATTATCVSRSDVRVEMDIDTTGDAGGASTTIIATANRSHESMSQMSRSTGDRGRQARACG